jgi:hypothetical protein
MRGGGERQRGSRAAEHRDPGFLAHGVSFFVNFGELILPRPCQARRTVVQSLREASLPFVADVTAASYMPPEVV